MSAFGKGVVATGELYKQGHFTKNWKLRRFELSGAYMIYFDEKQIKKGEIDITECSLIMRTPEECQNPNAQFAFEILGPSKNLLLSASTARHRDEWIQVLQKQIEAVSNPLGKFLHVGEVIHADGNVSGPRFFGLLSSKYRLLLTNLPRLLILSCDDSPSLKYEIVWPSKYPPTLTKEDDSTFTLSWRSKSQRFHSSSDGSEFWVEKFSSLNSIEKFQSNQTFTVIGGKNSTSSSKQVQIGQQFPAMTVQLQEPSTAGGEKPKA